MRPSSLLTRQRLLFALSAIAPPTPPTTLRSSISRISLSATPPRRRTNKISASQQQQQILPAETADATAAAADVYVGSITPRVLSEREKKVVAYRQEYRCAACDCLLPPGYQVDHITPLALGGTNGLSNLQALCMRCHTRKTRSQRHDLLAAAAARDANAAAESLASTAAAAAATPAAEQAAALQDIDTSSGSLMGLDAIELSSLRLLRGMNQQQLAAVVCSDGPMRVAAGPGTGKTRVLTARIAHLIVEAKVPPQRVLAVTFTNKAARELRVRITRLIGPDDADSVTMGTFHSLCLAMLRQDIEKLPEELPYKRGFAVYDEYASLKLIKKLKLRIEGGPKTGAAVQTGEQKKKEEFSAGAVQSIISAAKNDMYDAQSFRSNPPVKLHSLGPARLSLVASVFEAYQQALRDENVIDFDDMLLLTETLLRTNDRVRKKYASHWRHIAVDEFQDTNSVQYELLALLGKDHKNVFVVGDADQAIYGWRGADIRNQARLDSDFVIRQIAPTVPPASLPPDAYGSVTSLQEAVREIPLPPLPRSGGGRKLNLELNYRSRQGILDMAYRLLAPAYGEDPASQLRLVTPSFQQAEANGEDETTQIQPYAPPPTLAQQQRAALQRAVESVQVIELEDSDHEAEYVVDEILRIRDMALAANAAASSDGKKQPDPPSMAVLYRTNTQSMAFERRLVREGVPYVLAAQRSFYARKEIRDLLAYLQLLRSNDTIALERIINVPARRIGATTMDALHDASEVCGVSLWRAVELYATSEQPTTTKKKKGADADAEENEDQDEERAMIAKMPPLRKNVVEALKDFYELIMRFRSIVQEAAADAAANSTEASQEDDDEVKLRMVSTEIRRRQRDPRGRDPEGRARLALKDGASEQQELLEDLEMLDLSEEEKEEEEERDVLIASEVNLEFVGDDEEEDEEEQGDALVAASRSTEGGGLAALLKLILVESGYEAMLQKGGEEETGRWRNLGELANLASERRVDELNDFLDQIALVSDVDALDGQGTGSPQGKDPRKAGGVVQLSTIHGAKGLEFDHVFVTGVEEGLLPHYYCTDSDDEIEQERRLLYVAMTRAKERLVLTHGAVRGRWGKVTPVERSRFLDDLPDDLRREIARIGGRRRRSARW